MTIFGKKNEQEELTPAEDAKLTRKLKDLKPENKKKRKEPPKPWGKKERIIILIVLLATTIISAMLLLSNNAGFNTGKLHINLPKINFDSINIFKGETIVIEKE